MYTKLKAFISIAILSLSLFIVPVSLLLDTHEPTQLAITVQPSVAYANDAECGVVNGTLLACVPGFFKMTLFWPAYFILRGSGVFFDFFMDYSISSQTYSTSVNFVTQGWAAVRDIANIFFIFVLLYIAIGTILNLSQVNTKKMLVKVILIALLINFSLFFTRVIIDASNILARSFVSSINLDVTQANGQPSQVSYGEYSAGIVSVFDPQTLLATGPGTMLDSLYGNEHATGQAAGTELAFIFVATAILLGMAYAFIVVGIMLLGRVIELWYLMIIAPIAFISIVLPFNIPKLGWSSWIKNLVSTAFMAPVFMFFIYLILKFLTIGLDNVSFTNSTSMWSGLLQILIPFIIVLILVLKAKDVAEKMAGDVGAAFAKAGNKIAGLGAAALTGGAAGLATMGLAAGAGAGAAALRGTVGKYAANNLASSTRGGFRGRMERSLGNTLKSSSMDWRQTSAGKKIIQGMGLNKYGNVNAFAGKGGGYQGFKDRYQKSREDDANQRIANEAYPLKVASDKVEAELAEFEGHFAGKLESLAYGVKIAKQKFDQNPVIGGPEYNELQEKVKAQKEFFAQKQPEFGNQSWNQIDRRRIDAKHALAEKEAATRKKAADEIAEEGFWTSGFQQKSQREHVTRSVRGNRNKVKIDKPKEKDPEQPKVEQPKKSDAPKDSGGEK